MVLKNKRIGEIFAALARLSRREKYMAGAVGATFLLFVGLIVTIMISSSLSGLEHRISEKTRRLQEILTLRHQYAQAKSNQEEAEKTIEKGRRIQLMGTLENLATQIGIDTQKMEMNPRGSTTDPESGIEEKKTEVTIPMITIDRLVEFLEKAEGFSDCIKIRTLQIKKNFKEPKKLDVVFSVSKYEKKPDKAGVPGSSGSASDKK